MFTRLLVGLDGSPRSDAAFEQALLLARRFGATVVAAYVRESGKPDEDGQMLERAGERAAEVAAPFEAVEKDGEPDLALAELAHGSDAVLVGRRGVATTDDALGPTVASLIRIAQTSVIVCGGTPSPMKQCAVAYDGRATAKRALELAARFATTGESTVHVIHAAADRDAGLRVVGEAEAALSMLRVPFVTHLETGKPGEVVARVIARTKCDALFAGAHVPRERTSLASASHAEEILRTTDIPVVIQP
jgi:nucleotide-binding universal stress UspA family protein